MRTQIAGMARSYRHGLSTAAITDFKYRQNPLTASPPECGRYKQCKLDLPGFKNLEGLAARPGSSRRIRGKMRAY